MTIGPTIGGASALSVAWPGDESQVHGHHGARDMTSSGVAQARLAEIRLVARMRLELAVAVDRERVPSVLGAAEAPWLGERIPSCLPAARSYLCDLELQVGRSERSLFHKATIVSLGRLERDGEGWIIPIEWRAATLTSLFPVLAGTLHIDADGVVLDGHYAPPGGRIGYVLDTALLGAAARQTGRWFLRTLVRALA